MSDADLFHCLDLVALGGDALAQEVIIVSVLEEAAELFVPSRLLRVRHGEEMIFSHKPVAETAKQE